MKNYDKILFQNNDDLELFLNLSILKKNQLNSIVPSSGVEINLYESNKYLYPEKITFGLTPDCDFPADISQENDGTLTLILDTHEIKTNSHNFSFLKNKY